VKTRRWVVGIGSEQRGSPEETIDETAAEGDVATGAGAMNKAQIGAVSVGERGVDSVITKESSSHITFTAQGSTNSRWRQDCRRDLRSVITPDPHMLIGVM
jgi:hypothetical protein